MAFTKTWQVTGLRSQTEGSNQDSVIRAHWKITATDEDGHTASFIGATPFSSANVAAEDFIAFENLTEETVISWIQNVVNSDPVYKAHIDERLQKALDYYHVAEPNLPWNNQPSVAPNPEPQEGISASDAPIKN